MSLRDFGNDTNLNRIQTMLEVRVIFFLFFSSLFFFFIIPLAMDINDMDDKKLAEIPLAKPLLGYAVNERNIKTNEIGVGVFVDSYYLSTSFLEPISTQVKTSRGVFVVKGNVNAIKGLNVTISGTNDKRLTNKLCIADNCYSLLNYKAKITG